ncbi:hypothetical protein DMI80_09985 [Akkermansia muciniphila]|uniref:portal protein n=1 Tax=Akkermansia muciniphila TaxID=239935 RepID=UPI00138E7C1D|nr:portal protein [Akkermansia muciniphila]QHV66203.1 hypothetical protein DMI78_09975 [Akkermansia muciniphila]QHV68638.1 hypothetical protein DMI79_10010 [Akkermansia muciniphila]QHV71117.1 hypothetical protein DMI80_09985 [Akkermansia muciniphila]QHV73572.1 hypothetical protein DMI81_09985 [Akkermansia muciniphila]
MDYIRTSEALLEEMRSHSGEWDWLRRHIMPHTQADADQNEHPGSTIRRLHSTVACDSLHILAGAHIMYITPTGQQWFSLKSGKEGNEKRLRYDNWFARATEITHKELAKSNFYTVIHQCFIDRCLTGTGCVFCSKLPDGTLNFKHIPTGTYALAEGRDDIVDTVVRLIKLTPHQAVEQFGSEKLPRRILDAWDDEKRRYTEKHQYLHLVIPRSGAAFGHDLVNPLKMKWASIYMAWDADKTVIKESGYNEFPFLVTRFLKFGESPYGYSPGMNVKEEIKATLKLERVMDVLGEVAAFPRLLTMADQVGEIDMRAGGRTVVKPQAAGMNMPREWATSGRYDIGKDRIQDKEEKIRQAFYVPMLQVISSVDRQMTATEVNAREGEKVLAFSPSMSLFISDCNTLINRIFSMLFRMGKYPTEDMPDELVVRDQGGTEDFEIKIPAVSYNGKISQAIERAQRNGGDYYIQNALAYTQATGDPSMIEIVDMRKYGRFLYESTGAPTDCLRKEKELEALDQQRAAAAQQQAQLEAMQGTAKAGRDIAAAQK